MPGAALAGRSASASIGTKSAALQAVLLALLGRASYDGQCTLVAASVCTSVLLLARREDARMQSGDADAAR